LHSPPPVMKITRHTLPDFLLNACVAVWLVLSGVEGVIDEHGANYDRIEDGLYVGGDVASPPWGTKAVLNLCEKEDAYPSDVPVYRLEAIPDSAPAPSLDWLREMVEFIECNRKAGRRTYVHCRNGVSRSGLVVLAYEMFKNGWTRDEALAFVKTKRGIVRPNRAFMERLLEWEQVMKGNSRPPLLDS
jgi:Dual specificity phosphatase, catalytic domain